MNDTIQSKNENIKEEIKEKEDSENKPSQSILINNLEIHHRKLKSFQSKLILKQIHSKKRKIYVSQKEIISNNNLDVSFGANFDQKYNDDDSDSIQEKRTNTNDNKSEDQQKIFSSTSIDLNIYDSGKNSDKDSNISFFNNEVSSSDNLVQRSPLSSYRSNHELLSPTNTLKSKFQPLKKS